MLNKNKQVDQNLCKWTYYCMINSKFIYKKKRKEEFSNPSIIFIFFVFMHIL